MQVPIIVVGDVSGRYVSGIESQRGRVSVVRHVQDLGEMLGIAQSGIARAVLLVTQYEDLTQSMLSLLADLDIGVCAVTDGAEPLAFTQVRPIDALADIKDVLAALEQVADDAEYGGGESAQPLSPATSQPADTEIAAASTTAEPAADRNRAETANSPRPARGGSAEDPHPGTDTSSDSREGSVLTIWGAQGSPGRTTLAVNLAGAFADAGLRVCLIDTDTYGSSVGAVLGLSDDYSSLAQLCHYADRRTLTTETVQELASTIRHRGTSLDVITGLNRTDRWPEVRGKALAEVFTVLRQSYDLIIADTSFCLEQDENLAFDGLAPLRNDGTLTSIYEADHILAVGAADVVGVPRAIKGLEALKALLAATMLDTPVSVAFNRVRAEAIGGSATVALGHAWQRFGPAEPISWFISEDRSSVDKSWLAGKTIFETAPKSALARELAQIHRDLTGLMGLATTAEPGEGSDSPTGVVEKKGRRLFALAKKK